MPDTSGIFLIQNDGQLVKLIARPYVFVEFADHDISEDNIARIIAFPDADSEALPLREKRYLGKAKVDLCQVPAHFIFSGLDEFEKAVPKLAELSR